MTKSVVTISGRSSFVNVATVHVWSCLLLLLLPPPSSVSSFQSVITAGQHQHQRNFQLQPLFAVPNKKKKNNRSPRNEKNSHHDQKKTRPNMNRRNVLEDIMSNTVAAAAAAIVTGAVTEIVALPAASAVAVEGTAAASSASSSASQFGDLGTRTPLPAAKMMGVPGDTTQFTTFANGIKIKDFKVGTGTERVTGSGNTVSIQCNGRLINTNAGITFYNTKTNNPDGFGAIPLTFTLGQQAALPGLEFGLIGMKKGGIRRIVIPPDDTLSYTAVAPNLEPKPTTPEDQRALDAVVKNPRRDSTVMFDVKLERFK